MRTVHFLALSAALALGAGVVAVDGARAQGVSDQTLMEMSPPADSTAEVGKPLFDDMKFQTSIALPPKSGSLVPLNGRLLNLDMVAPPRMRGPAPQTRPK